MLCEHFRTKPNIGHVFAVRFRLKLLMSRDTWYKVLCGLICFGQSIDLKRILSCLTNIVIGMTCVSQALSLILQTATKINYVIQCECVWQNVLLRISLLFYFTLCSNDGLTQAKQRKQHSNRKSHTAPHSKGLFILKGILLM